MFKKYWKLIFFFVVLCFFSLFIIPHLVNRAYRIPRGIQWLEGFASQIGEKTIKGKLSNTVWDAKDILLYFGSSLAFIGTVFLGGVALYQNKSNMNLIKSGMKCVILPTLYELDGLGNRDHNRPSHYALKDNHNGHYKFDVFFINEGPHATQCFVDGSWRIYPAGKGFYESCRVKDIDLNDINTYQVEEICFKQKNNYNFEYLQVINFSISNKDTQAENNYRITDVQSFFKD